MKKLLSILILCFAISPQAQTVVPVVWVFALSSSQGNMVREIIQEANSRQTKYQFIFEHKPGAGGAVAAAAGLSAGRPAHVKRSAQSHIVQPLPRNIWRELGKHC